MNLLQKSLGPHQPLNEDAKMNSQVFRFACAYAIVFTVFVTPAIVADDPTVTTVNDLIEMRGTHDKTTWAKEVTAQKYESVFVKLWDALLQQEDKYGVFRQFVFDSITLPQQLEDEPLDWQIIRRTFTAAKQLDRSQAMQFLNKLASDGYEVIETEWHHSSFRPATEQQPAKSKVSFLLHVTKSDISQRIIVRGNLGINWAPGDIPQVATIDATDVTLLLRNGPPGFEVNQVMQFDVNLQSKKTRAGSIHPVIVHDLNNDGLPEIVISDFNEVYWNQGDWKFDKKPLCKYPLRNVRAGVFADFTADGIDDYLCFSAMKPPVLYRGSEGGQFDRPAQTVGIGTRMEKPSHVTVGDVDGDGDLDAFMGQQKPSYTSGFIPTPYYDANDGYPFILMLNDGNGRFTDGTLLAGLGKKRNRHVFSCTLVDLDDDADLDLLLTNDFCGCDYFLNDGKGVFTDARDTLQPTPRGFGMSHSFGDYNLDGQLDVIAIGMSSTTARRLEDMKLFREGFADYDEKRPDMGYGNRLFLNAANGLQQAPFNDTVARTGWSWGSTTFDFDRDGDQDIYIGNGQTSGKTTKDYCTRFWCHDLYYKPGERPDNAVGQLFKRFAPMFSGEMISWNGYEHNALLMNQDGQKFLNVGFLMNVGFEFDARTVVSGDLDQDGKVDLLVEHKDLRGKKRNLHIIRNQWQDDHHWLGIHLRGNTVDTPHGAKVTIELEDGTKRIQHRLTGHSVWAQHPNSIHFGTGQQKAKRLTVQWQGGSKSTIDLDQVDRYITVSPSIAP